jgi:hypothetical protein
MEETRLNQLKLCVTAKLARERIRISTVLPVRRVAVVLELRLPPPLKIASKACRGVSHRPQSRDFNEPPSCRYCDSRFEPGRLPSCQNRGMHSVKSRPPRALPTTDLESYLLGTWQLTREIIDHSSDRLRLTGSADIERLPNGVLSYFEQATLDAGAKPLEFTRTYLFCPTGATSANVVFEDGSRFYELDLKTGRCRVRHLCDQDLYLGLILTTETGWYTRWRCRGPRKSYVATTYLSRVATTSTVASII